MRYKQLVIGCLWRRTLICGGSHSAEFELLLVSLQLNLARLSPRVFSHLGVDSNLAYGGCRTRLGAALPSSVA